ncbi:hypothetical protein EUGRSUZ_D02555 [Eucalyptus grandis]|uniref:Uncharacterized protein n=2 Tax=Eucalyptus grandis TaxID=71139 RepID=A0ACC3L8M1_EUCGR|nr:hypothetical protein EUGRSUZ_D02555 [Eucalyptus grandis]
MTTVKGESSLLFLVLNFVKTDGLPSSCLRDIPKYQLITKKSPMSFVRLPPAPLPPSSPHVTVVSSITTRGKPKSSKSRMLSPTSILEPMMATNKSLLASLASKKGESLPLSTLMFKALDDIIIDFLDPPVKPSLDPRTVLSGNFAPVDELSPTECEVLEGSLPQCLDGAYIRNGPNPQFVPRGAYHLFDGDGMLHSIRISRGRATFCSRYVKTNKYTVEHNLGSPVFPNIFSGYSDGDIEMLGRHNFEGMLSMSMTAHPKVDRETGEAYAYKYNPFFPPYLNFFKFDRDGVKQPDMPILSLSCPPFLHDFAITRKYAVFPETQMGVNPKGAVLGGSIRMDLVHGLMEKIKINLKDGRVSRRPISAMNLDLPVMNPAFIGKYNRYVYAGVADPMPKMSGVVKLDLAKREGTGECVVASRNYGPGCYGGEPFFVARDPEYPEAEEDDGYLMSYVHDEKVNGSRFLVMDAKSPDLEVVAVVKLPQRVPYGFHGIFVRDNDLNKL